MNLGAILTLLPAAALAQTCMWTQTATPPAPPFTDGRAVYDPAGQRTLMPAFTNGLTGMQLYAFAGGAWTTLNGAGPSVRIVFGAALDSARGRLVMFGGRSPFTSVPNAQTWEWDGNTWLDRTGPGPSARSGIHLVYDSARGRTVLFGGQAASAFFADTWEWDGAAWMLAATTGPSQRADYAMAYDSLRARVVLFGGRPPTISAPTLDDLWEWDGATWTPVPIQGPSPGGDSDMTYDLLRARIVLHSSSIGYYSPTTWEYDGQSWTFRTGASPPTAVFGRSFVYDPVAAVGRWFVPSQPVWEYRGDAPLEPVWFRAAIPERFVSPGTTVVFAADVGGSDPRTYQWSRNNVPLQNGGNISGVQTPNLSIDPVSASDAGNYSITVGNACGQASRGANLLVRWSCYANCDRSTVVPFLNVQDFSCFINQFAGTWIGTNCDESTIPPVLNVLDFSCFLNAFANGCSAP